MDIIGIIVEYNPFHNGHIYHINMIKELYPDSVIIAVMSSCFTQRGDVSIMNKWDKTKVALEYGCDIVIEMPFKYSCQGADIFASYSVAILNDMGVKKIVFGSESCDIEKLKSIAYSCLNDKFNILTKKYVDNGLSYPSASSLALEEISGYKFVESNDILGVSYIKEILKNNYDIEPICIRRTNDFNSISTTGVISSASSIRDSLKKYYDISDFVPNYTFKHIYNINNIDTNYFNILKYKIISEKDLSVYTFVEEGLNNRIIKYINNSNNLNELVTNLKSKRYTYVRIKRMLTHILCNSKKEDGSNKYYIRILGFSNRGKKYLACIRGKNNIPIYTNYNKIFQDEYKITCIYSYIVGDESLIEKEYKNKPIVI